MDLSNSTFGMAILGSMGTRHIGNIWVEEIANYLF
jgi:hypothetical protein